MAETLKQVETIETYPDAPAGLSTKAAELAPVFLWQRIEAYTTHRFTSRSVEWVVEGPGDWTPPLAPATIDLAEIWNGTVWETATPDASPMGGYTLSGEGLYRFTGIVGAGTTVPAAVNEAYRRLAEYSFEIGQDSMATGHPSHTSHTNDIGNAISESFSRGATWSARALQLSGAADLLRPYRRA